VNVTAAPAGSLALCAAYDGNGKLIGRAVHSACETAWTFSVPVGSEQVKVYLLDGGTLQPLTVAKTLEP